MPIYDYQCDRCDTTFEVRASFKEKEAGLKPVCPTCQNAETHQLLTVGMFVRGGGNGGASNSSCCGPDAGPGCCGG
jgi:putative FmdB family regulatory protein